MTGASYDALWIIVRNCSRIHSIVSSTHNLHHHSSPLTFSRFSICILKSRLSGIWKDLMRTSSPQDLFCFFGHFELGFCVNSLPINCTLVIMSKNVLTCSYLDLGVWDVLKQSNPCLDSTFTYI